MGNWIRKLVVQRTLCFRCCLETSWQGIFQLKDEALLLNKNGQLIIVRGDELIITDGRDQLEILETIGKRRVVKLAELEKEGYDNVLDIFIAEYDKGQDQCCDLLQRTICFRPIFFSCKIPGKALPFLRYWGKIVKWKVSVQKKDRKFHEEENTEVWESIDNTISIPYLLFSLDLPLFGGWLPDSPPTILMPNWQSYSRRSNKGVCGQLWCFSQEMEPDLRGIVKWQPKKFERQ